MRGNKNMQWTEKHLARLKEVNNEKKVPNKLKEGKYGRTPTK